MRERVVQMLGPAGVSGDEGQVDVRGHRARQLHLGLLAGFLEALKRHRVLGQIDPLIPLEFTHDPVDDTLVKVVAAQMGIAVGGLHLELAHEPLPRHTGSSTEMS